MNLEKYKAQNELTNNDIVELVKPEFPKFGKAQVSMVAKGTYGVVLDPKAAKILNEAHPTKENRTRGNRVTVWVNDYLYGLLLSYCESEGRTRQDACETAIYTMLKPEARMSEPRELNSKRKAEWKYCQHCGAKIKKDGET